MKMTWQKLKDKALQYDTIFVTGCQRTGTTFCAKALAEEIGYKHIDEGVFNANDLDLFLSVNKYKSVVQCPALFHLFPLLAEDGLIVYIDRSTKHVIKSMVDCGWYDAYGIQEYKLFERSFTEPSPRAIHNLKENHFYSNLQYLENVVKLPFKELKKAKGYMPTSKRKGFTIKQTS